MPSKKPPAGLPLRRQAAEKLKAVLGGEAFSPFSAAEIADGRDRALANRLVTTALRRQGHIDHVIDDLLDKGLPKKSGSFEAVLRLALAQLLYLPDLGAHSALFLAGEAIKADPKARHLSGLMNAVLRSAQGRAALYWDLPADMLFPRWMAEGWTQAYGPVLESFGQALIAGAPLDLTLRADDAELVAMLGARPALADSVRVESRDRPVEALPGYAEGRWWVQDLAAALPARLMALPGGARVIDLCAAPGGKTAQLAKAGYAVTALDADAGRLERLKANLDRIGLAAGIVAADALTYRPEAPADGVLLDAPCSATGIFRRHPEVVWHRRPEDVAERARLQRRLLANAAQMLRPGGVLVYCVCSLQPEEGEAVADWAVTALGLRLLPVRAAELPGLAQAITPQGFLRTHAALDLPAGLAGGMDGFFAARFEKP